MVDEAGEPRFAPGTLPADLTALEPILRGQGSSVLTEPEVDAAETLLGHHPERLDLMFLWARAAQRGGRLDVAERWYRRVGARDDHWAPWYHLAQVCATDTGRLSEALQYSGRAFDSAPTHPWVCAFHGKHTLEAGHVAEGIALLERAAELAPGDWRLAVNPLWYRQYLPGHSRAAAAGGIIRWAQRFLPPQAVAAFPQDADPGRRLRIGYISPDLQACSLLCTFEPVLDGHDRDRWDVLLYGRVARPDENTARLRTKCTAYQNVAGLSDEAIAARIRADGVDVLVALGGHCTGNALPVLARRPAPVQVDWGGVGTTGLVQVDYSLSDAILDPPEVQPFYTERLCHLPGGFSTYRPPERSPAPGPLPARERGVVTFGSLNNHLKISATTLDLWSRVLRALPSSRLLLKFRGAEDTGVRSLLTARLSERGVAPQRLEFVGALHPAEHLAALRAIDLVLDTTPFTGCVTAMEALWMGLPVVTLRGDTKVGRQATAILAQVGLDDWSAADSEAYVARALAAARDLDTLASLRAGLRARLLNSSLCDAGRLARELEAQYRWMWRRACADTARWEGSS